MTRGKALQADKITNETKSKCYVLKTRYKIKVKLDQEEQHVLSNLRFILYCY